ncbi:hypothetical protein FACS189461_4060 [Spirochaetia bacterium]|nr:hypothetical protein FACS189461_4060 [Spirochaetia bacterium]
MVKESIYNHYLFREQDVLLYNHLSGVIGKVLDPARLRLILESIQAGTAPKDGLYTALARDGFFVDTDCDEQALGELVYHDAIYANALDVTVLGSEACNFRCGYCYEDFRRENITEEVMDSFLLYLKKNLGIQIEGDDNFILAEYIVDSLTYVSLLTELEQMFEINIPDEYLMQGRLESFQDICNMVEGLVN